MRTATTRRPCGAIPCSRWRCDRDQPAEEAVADLLELDLDVIAFDRAQGEAAGRLRSATRQAGLSLRDCACLALAQSRGVVAFTTDRAWTDLDVGVAIEVVR